VTHSSLFYLHRQRGASTAVAAFLIGSGDWRKAKLRPCTSTILSAMHIPVIMNHVAISAEMQHSDTILTDFDYADGIALLVDDPDKLRNVLLTMENEAVIKTEK